MIPRCAILAAGLALVAGHGLAAVEPMNKAQIKSVVRVESLTIPTPGEFFAAIDKQAQPNWTQLFQPKSVTLTSSRSQMALMLGVLVADGYIAVEAQDGQGVKNTGKEIINLGTKLNVSKTILGRGNSINDFAENNDWSALREELEATQNEVKLAMAEQKDQNLVILVTVGAWARGIDVASRFIDKNYTPGLASLLRQPAIIDYLLSQLSLLPSGLRTDPQVLHLQQGLESILKLVDTDPAKPPTQEAVKSLSTTATELVTSIAEGAKKQ